MTAFADLSDVIAKGTGSNIETVWFHKEARIAGAAATATIAGRMASLWTYDGSPAGGTAPGAVAIPDNTTTGGLLQSDPGGGRQKWILGAGGGFLNGGTLIIGDRLLHISGLDGTNAGAQTVGGTMTRYATNGTCSGNWIVVEIYTQIGATSRTITASYTNQAGTNSRTTVAANIGNTNFREQTRALLLPLQAGDTGVEAVASVTLSATTGTAGNFGVTVFRPLIMIGASTGGGMRDLLAGLPPITECLTDACLAMYWVPSTTTAPEFQGFISMVEA